MYKLSVVLTNGRKPMKKIVSLILALTMLSSTVLATSESAIKNNLSSTNKEISDAQKELSNVKNDKKLTLKDIDSLDKQIENKESEIAYLENDIKTLEKNIVVAEENIQYSEEQYSKKDLLIGLQHEVLGTITVLAIHQPAVHEVWKNNAFFYISGLRHFAAYFVDAFGLDHLGRDSPLLEPIAHVCIQGFFVGQTARLPVFLGFLSGWLHGFRCMVNLLRFSEEKTLATIVAMGYTLVPIYGQ